MLNYLKRFFNLPEPGDDRGYSKNYIEPDDTKKLQVATCTLFIELAKADDNFNEQERDKILSIMKSLFDLEDDCINDLIVLSEKRLEKDDNIYDFTKIINQNFSNEEKFELLKDLWRLIYVDDKLDMYEDHLIKKIGGLLNMGHTDIIAAKLLVKEEIKGK